MTRRWVARAALTATILTGALTFSSGASAYQFGKAEEISKLADLDVTREGHKLYLGQKTATVFFLLGVYANDDGYVLGVSDEPDTYYETSAEELKAFQERGLLPAPLPPHGLTVLDYLIGYSLWITLAVIALVYGVGWLRKRGVPAVETTPPTAT
jgi:hypothetical protein